MLDAIRRPLRKDEGMQPESAMVADRLIKPNDRLRPFDRLEIYNQQYWWRLIGAFGEDFPAVRAVIGPRKFDALTVAYLEKYPSRSWTMRNLGQHLAEFIAVEPQWTAPNTDLAADVARVEWATTTAFDDADVAPIEAAKFASADPSRLRLALQPHLVLLQLHHAVDRLLARLRRKRNTVVEVASNAVTERHAAKAPRLSAQRLKESFHLAVHRSEGTVYFKRLNAVSYGLLCALRDGKTVEEACEAVVPILEQIDGDATALIRQSFATFSALGWLVPRK
jgi:hypothetical protein